LFLPIFEGWPELHMQFNEAMPLKLNTPIRTHYLRLLFASAQTAPANRRHYRCLKSSL
jgi:hypothetical protein